MARGSQSVVEFRTRNPLFQPSPLTHELVLMGVLGVLGIVAARLNVRIPHTQVFIEGRWIFGYMGFVLLRRWPLAILLASVLSLATLAGSWPLKAISGLPAWYVLVGNLLHAIPSFLVIRGVHDRLLSRVGSLLWYGVGWMAVILLCYQLFSTPIIWGLGRDESFLQSALQGWLTQPFLLESVLVALVSGSAMVALRSHAQMRRSSEQLATTLDSIGDAVISTDAEGRIVRMNPIARTLTGYSQEEATGKPFDEVVRLEDSQTGESMSSPVGEVLESGDTVEMSNTTRLVTRDGTRRHIADSASPLRNSAGQLLGVVVVFRDVTEEHRRRRSLRRNRDMLRRTEAIAHVGSWEWDIAADKVTWSDELYRIFGLEPSRTPPNWASHDVLYTSESMARLRSAVGRTLEDGTPYELELNAVRPDGEIRTCLCRGHAEMGPGGKPVRLFGSLQDITELRRTEEELRESEQRFRSFVESANDILYAVAPDGTFTYISPNWLEFMGEPAERAVGRSFVEYVHPEDVHLCRTFLDKVLTTGEKQSSVEYRVYRADGVMRWHVSNGSPMRDEQGRAIGYMGIARDVTEQKQRRDAFARFCDMSTDLICLADINTATFLQVNPAATDILGYSEEELLSQPFTNFIHPDDLEATHRVIEEQLLKGQNLVSFENRYFRKDGEIRWLQWNSHPLPEEGLTYAIAYDVTERKQAEQERRNLESQLLQAQKMEAVGRLAGGVAHDFNNKLQTILGYSDILLHEENLPRSLQECVEEIHEAAVRSADLTRQLLAFARKQTISPRVLNLNETVPEMLRMLKPLISEEIDLQWYPGENVGTIRMDPAQLDQILANLVVNARDAIKQTGTITVETQNVEVDPEYVKTHPYVRPGRHVQLAVSDDGAGMDADTLDQIFEPFFTTKPSDQGTGLGLATVYGIAKQNGGFVNVYSEPGTGTTFRIYLPLTDEDTPVPPTHDRPDAAHTGSETILLVEDDPSVLRLGQKTLEELGYTVLAADRPDKALDMVDRQSAPIDLLVTDVVMPEMNGKDLLARLSKNRPGLRALFMSGYTANVIAHRGVLDEGIEFLQKPFRAVDFAARVRQVLGNSNPSD